ncbi:MAG: CPBP family intramembrane metalloprotease [Labilibaculum sp.]|nr:CPBP family intramembrane metalloprotease [Labilibaculum sp.]
MGGFFAMGFVGAAIMLGIFTANLQLGFVQIEGTNDWMQALKQIPMVFISAFGEELFLRVFVFIPLMYLAGNKRIALVGSSVVFCFLHMPMDIISVLSYFLAGLMYGFAFLKFKSIWAAVGLQVAWNYFQGAVFGFPVSSGVSNGYFILGIEDSWIWNGGGIGPEGSVFGVLCRVLIIGIIFFIPLYI